MESKPVVTVLMSVYNGEKYLREAIDSILEQSYRDFEFVIYDDCSTDSSAAIIESYGDERIVFRRNESNQGLTRNLSDGVAKARGKYIARMDADDIALPQRLEKQVDWMDAHTDVAILGSQVVYFNEKGGSGVTREPLDDETIKAMLLVSFTMLHPTIMIRKELLSACGVNYDPSFRYSQDHALYFDCMRRHFKFANHPEPLLKMRAHGESISRARHGAQQECSTRARNAFLEAIGILNIFDCDELAVYNSLASGEFPESAEGVSRLASFAGKLLTAKELGGFVNVGVLRRAFADRAWGLAYRRATSPEFLPATGALAALSDVGLPCRWSLKMHMKFIVKRMLAVLRRFP